MISFLQAKQRAAALKLEQQIILADCQVLAAILNFINQVFTTKLPWDLLRPIKKGSHFFFFVGLGLVYEGSLGFAKSLENLPENLH